MSDRPQYPSYPGDDSPAGPPSYGQTSSYGQASPPPYGQYVPPPGYGQPSSFSRPGVPILASWGSRVGASLLDWLITFAIAMVPLVVGTVIALRDAEYDEYTDEITGGVDPVGVVIMLLSVVIYVGFDIWNRGIRVGTTGRSLGKQVVGISIISADSGRLLGGGTGFLRWLMASIFLVIVCVGVVNLLWPLWDEQKQTLHDKVVGSIATRS